MNKESSANLGTWQKIAVILIVIFGLVIAFSYFQSSRIDQRDRDKESAMTLPELQEGQTNFDIFDLPTPAAPTVETEPSPAAVSPAPAAVTTSPPVLEKITKPGGYTIQVSSFKDLDKAKRLQQRLKEKGYDAEIAQKDLSEKGVWYQVLVGQYTSKADAEAQGRELKAQYLDSFIRKR